MMPVPHSTQAGYLLVCPLLATVLAKRGGGGGGGGGGKGGGREGAGTD